MSFQQIETHIPTITAVLTGIITACAFCLSFYNLQLQAIESGINVWLSWMWPVCLDCLLIAGSLMVLRSSLRHESAIVGWSVLLTFTAISTGFNVIHSPSDIISRLAHAVPPVSLCVSIELLMLCIRSDMMQPCNTTQQHNDASPGPVQQSAQQVKPNAITARVQDYFTNNPETTIINAADALGLHRCTISRHLKRISAAALLQQDDVS